MTSATLVYSSDRMSESTSQLDGIRKNTNIATHVWKRPRLSCDSHLRIQCCRGYPRADPETPLGGGGPNNVFSYQRISQRAVRTDLFREAIGP